ncbi:hypothetical protein IDM40_00440 [Nocardiopsis sp. HNM0947]|uniref:Peptidoglycan binding domain-containing protein n=1 Tax=Nocardiopsis coralli TaxID=2772213 RepID=A0ABR9P004_9ACTN|nr:hypothetical protein [Nocardiopsis coralli]MBE2997173.1 hypothetical protein [Nocardiopsis coralli]
MTTDTAKHHPRRRRWTIGICVALVLALAVGLGLWTRSGGFRIARDIGDLTGVESAEPERSASEEVLRVEIASSTGEAEIETILEATEEVIDDEVMPAARVSLGTAEVKVGSRHRAETGDVAQALVALSTLLDGRAILDDQSIVFVDATEPPLVSILDWLTLIEEENLRVEDVEVEGEDGWNVISIHRLQTNHREVLESLGEWGPDITSVLLEETSLEIRTTIPFLDLGPLAQDSQSAARILDPESPRVTLETSDQRRLFVGDADPGAALEMAGDIEDDGWAVQSLDHGLTQIDVSAAAGRAADPSQLPGLAEALQSAGLPQEARVRVDEGVLFWGTRSDLEDLAPSIAQARAERYVVRWTRDDRSQGPDVRVWVEMPIGHSLSEGSDLADAIDVARSIPWPDTGQITLKTTPESGSYKDVREVTVSSTATGTAEEVHVDPDRLPGEGQLREAWDATATES